MIISGILVSAILAVAWDWKKSTKRSQILSSLYTVHQSGKCRPLLFMALMIGWTIKGPKKLASIWKSHVKLLGFPRSLSLSQTHTHTHTQLKCHNGMDLKADRNFFLTAGWALLLHRQPNGFPFSCVLRLQKVSLI